MTVTRSHVPVEVLQQGDKIPLRMASAGGGYGSASSTSYTAIMTPESECCVCKIPEKPEWASRLLVRSSGRWRNNTGGTGYLKLADITNNVTFPASEITRSGNVGTWESYVTPDVEIDPSHYDTLVRWVPYVKNSNGNLVEGTVNRTVTVFAEVK